jgi:hypothetical protein
MAKRACKAGSAASAACSAASIAAIWRSICRRRSPAWRLSSGEQYLWSRLQAATRSLDQSAAGAVQLLHGIEGSTDDGPHRRLEQGGEAGEQRRVDRVGFSMTADRFGEASGLAGIDLDQRQAGLGQAALEGAVIGAARLECDAGDAEAAEPGDQGSPSLGVISEPADPAGRMEMNLERVFGDVDADRLRYGAWHLFRVLCLSSGPSTPGYPFRPPGKERGDRTLARP